MKIADLGKEIRETWKPDNNKDSNLHYLGLSNIVEGKLQISEVGSSQDVGSTKYKFKEGDILFGTLRPYFRKVVIAPFDGVCSTEFSVIRPEDDNDREFLFYVLAQERFIDYATKNSSGARPRTKWELFSDFELGVIDKNKRSSIGNFLAQYDELIKVNRDRIELLNKTAELLFREWFIHHNYPRKIDSASTNGIPDGWKKKELGEIVELHYGKALKSSKRKKGDYPVYGSSGIIGTHNEPYEKGPGIIVGRKGNVGSVFWSSKDFHPIDTVYYIDKETSNYFIYHLLRNVQFVNNDAAVPGLNRDFAYSREILDPPSSLKNKFIELVKPLYEQINSLEKMNSELNQARDLLIPQLLNQNIPV